MAPRRWGGARGAARGFRWLFRLIRRRSDGWDRLSNLVPRYAVIWVDKRTPPVFPVHFTHCHWLSEGQFYLQVYAGDSAHRAGTFTRNRLHL